MNLATVLATLRRRWWLLVVVPTVAGIAAWLYAASQPEVYTAELLLRKSGSDAVLATWSSPLSSGGETVRAQFEIIRSRAVLGPVADSLGFRIRPPENVSQGELFSAAIVEPDAPVGRYGIRRRGDELTLVTLPGEQVEDHVGPGQPLRGPGLILRPTPRLLERSSPLEFVVVHRESGIRILRNRLRLDRIPETDLITISFTDQAPEYAADVVTAVAASYQRHSAQVAQREATRRRAFLRQEIEATADSMRTAQERALQYQEHSGALNPQLEGQSRLTLLMSAEEKLRNLRYDEATLAGLNEALQGGEPSDEVLRRAVVLGSDVLPTAASLYSRLQELKAERARLTASRFGLTEEGSQVQVVDSLISNVRNELREIAEHALVGVRQRREMEERRIQELRRAVSEVPSRSGELARLDQIIEGIQRRYDLLMGKYYEAQIAEAVETGDIEIIDPAVVPVIPNPSHTERTVVLAMFLGLMIGTASAFVLAHVDRRVQGREQAEEAANARVLAVIPKLEPNGARAGTRPLVVTTRRTASTEAFRSLRTMLRFSSMDGLGIVAVSSAEPGEGKSVVAANLAITMAADYPRVLLIDADFPRPVQHGTFGFNRERGLSDVLIDDATVDEAVRYHTGYNVHVLAAGTPVPNSAELLVRPGFRNLMSEAARAYDVVIVDTPPVLAVADAMAVATVADTMLLVVRDRATDRFALNRAANQIRNVGGEIAGLVLNDVVREAEYGSYYDNGRGGSADASDGGGRLRTFFRGLSAIGK